MQLGLDNLLADGLTAHVAESRAYNATAEAAEAALPRPDPRTALGLRESRDALPPRPAPPGPPAVEETARAAGRQVPVRVITPQQGDPRGVHLNIHGGGFYMGSAARGDGRGRALADALGIAVLSVDYRLAPEHAWPAAPEDCETAALWLIEQAPERFGAERLTIGGASAGATLAMTTLLRLRDEGLAARFAATTLLYGLYDLTGLTPAGRRIADEPFLDLYAGHVVDRTDPDVSPIYGDLSGLPPSLLVVGTRDLLFEESLAMAARLAATGSEVDLRVYPESVHGFTSFPTAMARAANADVEAWLAKRLAAA